MTQPDSALSTRIAGLSTQNLGYESLFDRLRRGHTLVTGNNRLARVLRGAYGQWRAGRGERQWQSPVILTWNSWVDRLWESAALQGIAGFERCAPGGSQLTCLWENILRKEPLLRRVVSPESLAGQLRDTREMLVNWQLDKNDAAWFSSDNENYAVFYRCNRAFEKHCETAGWISPEDRLAGLRRALEAGLLEVGEKIDLLGFDEFNPAQSRFIGALAGRGHEIRQLAIDPRNNQARLLQCRDGKHELQSMARWVRHWYQSEPQASIAVVVPDLQDSRREVERHLEEILRPGGDPCDAGPRPWNISMGTPLSRLPPVEAAFDLLLLLDERIDIQVIGRVLRSPWLKGGDSERNSRALLEKRLREKYPCQLKLGEISYRTDEIEKFDSRQRELPADQRRPRPWNSPEFSAVLKTLKAFKRQYGGLRAASEWAEAFDLLLMRLGWPLPRAAGNLAGGENVNDRHGDIWPVLQAWRESLRELATLDAATGGMGRTAAVGRLRQICRERPFQLRASDAPVQVLGLYEINGLRFDHLWVLGLHGDNWPAAARPNPFIPWKLQNKARLPHSGPQRELEVAEAVTRRLLDSAPDCVFSYPGLVDGEPVFPSPLFASMRTVEAGDLPAWRGQDWRAIVSQAASPGVEPLQPPGKLTHGTARGGSSILKNQSLCPFRAFAGNRLGAEALETPVDGISASLHGSLVHRALESFWKETRTRAALLQLDENALGTRLRKHVGEVVEKERALWRRPAFRAVEAERIQRHLLEFLALEKQREAFEVCAFELELNADIEGHPVRLFIDRIDRLASGKEIIIDYKTGRVDPRKWFGDRPEEAQLPLYAIHAEHTPAAVVFSVIRDDGCVYKGVVEAPGLFPGLPPKASSANQVLLDAGNDMTRTLGDWRLVLQRLMADFLAGEASVDPKLGLRTCSGSYCEFQSLCRVGELEKIRKSSAEHPPQETPG